MHLNRNSTHGPPNQINSHPHTSNSGEITLVHNGIIENYDSIKKILTQKGYVFHSDTDSEVLVNLIEDIKKTKNVKLGKAVYFALKQAKFLLNLMCVDEN